MALDNQLQNLESTGLIRLAITEPELEYLFRHGLVQDAVYASLLKADRRRWHLIVGETLERLYPDQPDELMAILARHFAAAGDRKKGVAYSRRAAQRAVATYASEEAAQHLRTALALLGDEAESEIYLSTHEELADVLGLLHSEMEAISHYHEALNVWHKLVDADRLLAVRLHRKIIQTVANAKWSVGLGDLETASQASLASRASLEDGLHLMQGEPPHAETVHLLMTLSTYAWRIQTSPDWDAAQRYAQSAVDMAEQLDNKVELSAGLGALAVVFVGRGLLRENLRLSLRRLTITQDPHFTDMRETLESLREAGSALMYVGEYKEALPYLLEVENLANRIQAVSEEFAALALQIQCWLRLDRWEDALKADGKWHALEQRHGSERLGQTCFAIALSATIHALRGDLKHADSLRVQSYGMMVATGGEPQLWMRNQHY
jgi:tetratricopeptide (TPR) repeat protein